MPKEPRRPQRAAAITQQDAGISLVASATRYPGSVTRIYRGFTDWQEEAWRHYDICGELRYAANWVSNVLSRATLHAARRTPQGLEKSTEGSAYEVLADLFDGPDGQAQMLAAMGLHLTVAGECYVVGRQIEGPTGDMIDSWEIIGTQEMRKTGKNWSIRYDGEKAIPLTDDDVVIRVWKPHPRKKIEADSPVRAVLPILTEIEYLTRHIFAQVTSRLAGAGVLMLPQGMSFPTPEAGPSNDADAFMQVLHEAMTAPIKDPGSPAALVPIVVTTPDDLVGKAEHLTFWSDLDSHAVELRTEAIRRLALGMDMPPEVMLGTGDANHWTGWQIEESSIKAHIEPLLELAANALTVGYLQPNTGDADDLVAFDTSALRLRPNRSREAIELFDRGELDGEALRRETGFTEDDAPDDEQRKEWFRRKVASGSTTPELVGQALLDLGVFDALPYEQGRSAPETPPPSLLEHPDRDLPEPQVAALTAASEILVFRALERAGNRIKNTFKVRPPDVTADELYLHIASRDIDDLLRDAWTAVPKALRAEPEKCERLMERLDAYTRHLLAAQIPHDRDLMMRYLLPMEVEA